MQVHDNNSHLVVRILAKRATALSQQVPASTEQRERRALEAHRFYSGIISDPSWEMEDVHSHLH